MSVVRREQRGAERRFEDAEGPPPLPPLWARIVLWGVIMLLRALLLLGRQSWRVLLLAVAGWQQLGFWLLDTAPQLGRLLVSSLAHGLRSLWGRILVPGIQRVLLPLARGLLLPTAVLGGVVGTALLLHQVDGRAAPKLSQPPKKAAVVASEDPFKQSAPELDAKQLATIEANLADASKRRAAVKRLLAASAEDAPLLHRTLLRRTKISARSYKRVLRRIHANVPDHRGRFSKKADAGKKKAPAASTDWLEDLLALDKTGQDPAYQQTLYTVALLRGLTATGRTEVATTLLRFAYRHMGAFRDECGRLLRELGDRAVPGLVRAKLIADPQAFRMARYAAYQLDRINRARPELALRQAGPELRAEILHAYGEARTTAAVTAAVAYTASPLATVRRAARWATLRYVSGREPKARKRRLVLVGGRTTQKARSLYYTYRQLAQHQLARRYGEALLAAKQATGPLDELVSKLKSEYGARSLAEKLFALQDVRRLEAQQAKFEDALQRARKGELGSAVRSLDQVLSRDPEHPHRGRIALVYLQVGKRALRAGRYDKAVLQLSKALLLLAPDDAKAREARALRLVAEARRDGGPSRLFRLRRALRLAPQLETVRKEVEQVEGGRRLGTTVAATTAGLAGAGLLLLLLALRRRRQAR